MLHSTHHGTKTRVRARVRGGRTRAHAPIYLTPPRNVPIEVPFHPNSSNCEVTANAQDELSNRPTTTSRSTSPLDTAGLSVRRITA